ncbi:MULTISPECIES: DUF3572 domain-containing protein [Shinella]|jgi:hypothetical protein|uniref:Uncharacterized protein DUF3572 n=1 Tax=Shinella granuli TaxID=323621 RepID=A0A4R2D8A1_SHIGR|nr:MULTISPECIES: DUF3572 domain-containing protein [Shinella]ANH03840.1 hypothetical protein shn_07150 [Shinella sp. HZN7]TCN47939.1 uncharacterized protein DUF3572 [Shinella granuli]
MKSQKDTPAVADAEATAVAILGWLAGEPELLSRFLSLTGVAPTEVRNAVDDPGFLAGVVGFLMDHEPTLLAFSAATGVTPEAVVRAHAILSGPYGSDDF